MAHIGIIYASVSGMIRRVIKSDTPINANVHVMNGESIIHTDDVAIRSPDDVNAAVKQAIGKDPLSPECAVLDGQGKVVGFAMADPALDNIAGRTLKTPYAGVAVDSVYNAKTDSFTIPAKTIALVDEEDKPTGKVADVPELVVTKDTTEEDVKAHIDDAIAVAEAKP